MSNNSYYNDQWRIINEKNQSLVSNYSMEFDASSGDTIQLNNAGNSLFNNATAFTISAWINPLDTGTMQNILTNYGNAVARQNVMLRWNSTEALQFYVVTTSGVKILNTVNNLIQYNQWQHIVATYDGINSKIYYNGTLSNSIAATGVVATSTEQDQIGWRAPYGQYFNGKMDQVCVFDYALSATQVSTLYGGGTAVTNPMSLSPKPIAYYQLGDQSVDNGANYLVPNNSLQDYVFNFDADRIDIANGSTIARQQNISYSAWINATSLSITQYIVGNNSSSNKGTSIFLLNDVLVFQFGDLVNFNNQSYFNSRVSNLSNYVNANEWFHVAASWDGTDSKIYINGIERNSWTPTQPPAYTISGWSNNFIIGRRADSTSGSFYGELSNIAFWNSGLTPTQVETIYNNGSPNDISSLSPTSWWKLNAQDTFDGTNWTIKDYAGSNDGTSVGMTSANLVQSNLQHTSGYSPYALDFDGINDYLDCGNVSDFNFGTGDFTVSSWINISSGNSFYRWIFGYGQTTGLEIGLNNTTNNTLRLWIAGSQLNSSESISSNTWHNLILKRESGSISAFLDNTSLTLSGSGGAGSISNNNTYIGVWGDGSKDFFQGSISNISAWNTGLTSSQISEIYNEGVPSNLHNFSGTAPVAWWQLGTNSSFNPNPMGTQGTWTCLDEIGSNNAASSNNMTNDDIVDGVGYSANGLGSSSIEIVGDAPYSTANGISENMDVLDRTTDVPPTV